MNTVWNIFPTHTVETRLISKETFLAVSECQYFTKKSDYAEENEFVL